MVSFASERARLVFVDFHIADGERRITRQIACIAHCRAAGHDTEQAERLLRELEGSLGAWQEHRAEILRSLVQIEDTLPRRA